MSGKEVVDEERCSLRKSVLAVDASSAKESKETLISFEMIL